MAPIASLIVTMLRVIIGSSGRLFGNPFRRGILLVVTGRNVIGLGRQRLRNWLLMIISIGCLRLDNVFRLLMGLIFRLLSDRTARAVSIRLVIERLSRLVRNGLYKRFFRCSSSQNGAFIGRRCLPMFSLDIPDGSVQLFHLPAQHVFRGLRLHAFQLALNSTARLLVNPGCASRAYCSPSHPRLGE